MINSKIILTEILYCFKKLDESADSYSLCQNSFFFFIRASEIPKLVWNLILSPRWWFTSVANRAEIVTAFEERQESLCNCCVSIYLFAFVHSVYIWVHLLSHLWSDTVRNPSCLVRIRQQWSLVRFRNQTDLVRMRKWSSSDLVYVALQHVGWWWGNVPSDCFMQSISNRWRLLNL